MSYEQEVQGAEEVSGTKTHKFLWLSFFGIIFIVIIVSLFFIFSSSNSKSISDKKLTEGAVVNVGENNSVKFKFGDEDHNINIDFVGLDSAGITISSEPVTFTLGVNEVKEVDLNNDGVYDIRVKLVKIENEKATIAVKKIDIKVCNENWNCTEWSDCHNGNQTRTCNDLNNCGTVADKPYIIKNCTEIEFIENDSVFDNGTNKSLNTTIINCGNNSDYSCFINASKTCHPAAWVLKQELNIFGITSSSSSYFEIKGYSNEGKCIYYQKSLENNLDYTDELKQSLLEQGYTSNEINDMETQAKGDAQTLVGTEKICKFNQRDLTNLLVKWENGSYSSEDYDVAECYPHGSFDCKLDFVDNMQIAGVSISSYSVMGNISISVKGYSNPSKISWSVENSSVISLSPLVGNSSKISLLHVGKTFIIIKDNSLSSCELKTPFEVIDDRQTLDCGNSILTNETITIGNTSNFDCFIGASENCEQARLLSTSEIELFGTLITTITDMEIKGIESNKCVYYQKTINQTVTFTDELIKQMLNGGATQEEIDQQEQIANNNTKSVWGLEKTCKFNTTDLTSMLNRWKIGDFSTEDFNVAGC